MMSPLLLDLLKLLLAESARANQQRTEIIRQFIVDTARRSPEKAAELATAGSNLFETLGAALSEHSKFQERAGKEVLSEIEVQRMANMLLGDLVAGPLETLSAASFNGEYSGYGSLLKRIHSTKTDFINVLASIEPKDEKPDWKNPEPFQP